MSTETMGVLERDVLNAIRDGLSKAIGEKLAGYSSPLDKLVAAVVAKHEPAFAEVLNNAIASLITDEDAFLPSLREALRSKLAKVLISKFGGEIEKRVNELRADPKARAQMVLALHKVLDDIGGAK